MNKVVLAYSGGLDTSVVIPWLKEQQGLDVIAVCVNVGENKDPDRVQEKANLAGAVSCYVVDARQQFLADYVVPSLHANAMYEGKYPLSAALSRPLIAAILTGIAKDEGAVGIAHGCTGKGNDQVRFDVSLMALNPDVNIIAPVREWNLSRQEAIGYASQRGIPLPVTVNNPFSIDENIWGRSIECGVIEDAWLEPPAEAFTWTEDPLNAPSHPEYITISFLAGVPIAIDGHTFDPVTLVEHLNVRVARHGVGRVDSIEDRLVGIKSREVYEAPAASVLIMAHRELEAMTLPRELLQFKRTAEAEYAEVVYNGLWYSPLREALQAFMSSTQQAVNGDVRVKLYRGNCQVVGRRSSNSLYDRGLATYDQNDSFDREAAVGFIKLWGMPTRVYAVVNNNVELGIEEQL